MSLSPPSGYSASTKTPGFVVGIEFGVGGKSAGTAAMRLCLMGLMTSSGTATLDTPVFVPGPDDADALFGVGSELARGCRRVFEQNRNANLWATPVTDGGGAAAAATLLFATTATASGTFRVYIVGELAEANIASGDTRATIATSVLNAINAVSQWPVTAAITMGSVASSGTSPPVVTLTGTPVGAPDIRIEITTGGNRGTAVFKWSSDGGATFTTAVTTAATNVLGSTGLTANFATGTAYSTDNVYLAAPTVTITQKNKGTRGNDQKIRGYFTPVGSGVSTTCSLNGGGASAVSVSGSFSGGTNTDNITNALANMATQKFDHVALANVDTTNWTRLRTHLNTYSGIAERKRQRGIVPTVKDLTSAITDSGGQNGVLMAMPWHYNAEAMSMEIAAQVGAARIWGDGQVGGGVGRSKGEDAYRGCNLDGTLLASIREQPVIADQPLGTEIELALNNGLTPLAPSPANPGFVRIVRSITNRFKDAQGNPNYAVLDTTKVEVIHYAADHFESFMANEFPNKNLVADRADGRPPRHEDSVTPSMLRASALAELYNQEDGGLAVDVDLHKDELTVEISADNPALALMFIPYAVINGLHNMAIDLAQIG